MRLKPTKYLLVLFLQGIAHALAQPAVFQPPALLLPPFPGGVVMMAQGPRYSDNHAPHLGAGFAFDYVSGNVNDGSTWRPFPILAAADGVAIRSCEGATAVSEVPFSEASCASGYGHFVLIRHDAMAENGERYFTLYAHLDPSTISDLIPWRDKHDTNFSAWRSVSRGRQIGVAGQSGRGDCRAGCIHLHFEVFIGRYFGPPVDPYDISDHVNKRERTAYPEFSSLARCGQNTLWAVCPRPPTVPRQMQTNQNAVVMSDAVNVRAGPSTDAAPITRLNRGDARRVIGSAVYLHPRWWWPIDVGQQARGWVAEELIAPELRVAAGRIGPISLGMTLSEARAAIPDAVFDRTTDGDGLALVGVQVGQEHMMNIFAEEADRDSPVDWSRRVTYIECFSPACATTDGVRVQERIADIERTWGSLVNISLSEIESREYMTFQRSPSFASLRASGAGIFDAGARDTTRYRQEARLLSVSVSRWTR